jgi:hypothetical protein
MRSCAFKKNQQTNLGVFSRDAIKDGPVCALLIAALFPGLRIALIALSETLRAEIVGVAKRLMYALKRFMAGHKDLDGGKNPKVGERNSGMHTRSKAVEQALG